MTASPTPTTDLLQRAEERARLSASINAAIDGDGGVVLLSGPAGIGKTALLREGRALGEAAGMTVLSAVGSELDRSFPFGLAHQLLEVELADAGEERRTHLTSGAARHALVIFDHDGQAAPEPGHTVLHGLYWMCANFTDERPLLLLIDDLHWGDTASLRFIEYLARRISDLPALVIATARTGEPDTDLELLDRIADVPGGQRITPAPLDDDAIATLLERHLGHAAGAAFVAAARRATGGNPFLLRALADEALHLQWACDDTDAARVDELGGGATSVIRRRLRSLGPDAAALTSAAAILGGRRRPEDAIAVAGLAPAAGWAALDVLTAAGILQPGSLEFAHPLLRAAASAAISASETADLHARASRHLQASGARPEELAIHLLHAAPTGDAELVHTLAAAARTAVSEGAPEAAIAYLERALAEPPQPEQRPRLLLELGLTEQLAEAPTAEAHLIAATEADLPADDAARAWTALGRFRLTRDPLAALAALERGIEQAESPDQRLLTESLLLDATAYLVSLRERRDALLAAGREHDPSPAMLAHLAQDSAYSGHPVEETLALVERALADGRLLSVVGPTSPTFHLLILTLRHAERPDLSDSLLTQAEAVVARSGSLLGRIYNDHVRAFWHLMFGSAATAEAFARSGFTNVQGMGLALPELSVRIILAELLLERDQAEEATTIIDAVPDTPVLDDAIIGADFLSVRAALRLAAGRRAEAETDLRRAVSQVDRRGWKAPLKSRAKLRLATLLADSDPEESARLAQEEVDAAIGAGTHGALGVSLRALARSRSGDEAIATLREADAALARSPLHLERGWALHDLGRALRIAGARVEAREPLKAALDLAERTESTMLRRLAQDELAASGARPRRTALSGVESLTPSERRVAELAAAGKSNREIAETLWVTRKTVEVHLGKAYGKLGIRTRGQLPAALGLADA
jgi:DNA-binding CsgD family transcriptional regulator